MNALRIPYHHSFAVDRPNLDQKKWSVLVNNTFPMARTAEGILLAWDTAEIRGLDVFAGHIAIVSRGQKAEVCWLTLKAQIFLAHKTGAFAGIDAMSFGPELSRTYKGMQRQFNGPNKEVTINLNVPSYATATVYRFVNNQRCAFSDTVFFDDVVGLVNDLPTGHWAKAPALMLAKVAKTSALRLAFGECDYTSEEADSSPAITGVDLPILMEPEPFSPANGVPSEQRNNGNYTNHAPQNHTIEPEPFHAPQDLYAPQHHAPQPQSFAAMGRDNLNWLDRSIDMALSIGAFDETIDSIHATLDPSLHRIATDLVSAVKGLAQDQRASSILKYIGTARSRDVASCEAAISEMQKQQDTNRLPQNVASAAMMFLRFHAACLAQSKH